VSFIFNGDISDHQVDFFFSQSHLKDLELYLKK
jgi:hypothetical protein